MRGSQVLTRNILNNLAAGATQKIRSIFIVELTKEDEIIVEDLPKQGQWDA